MNSHIKRATVALVAGVLLTVSGCEISTGTTYARRVEDANDLIGGPAALGTIGDYLIGNAKIRVIIQDQGWSRGFGVFGGGIIDADIVRVVNNGDTSFGNGKDNYGEFFPALFLEAWDVSDQEITDATGSVIETLPGIEVMCDGSEEVCDLLGEPGAVIRTRASGGDFLTMISLLLEYGVPRSVLRYETDYIIRPGARHVEITGRVINGDPSGRSTQIPLDAIVDVLSAAGIEDFQVPLGDVALFGGGNTVFSPGAVYRPSAPEEPKKVGFDLRFSVEATYETPKTLPALPGLVVDFLATSSSDVSYGYAVGDSERNYVWVNREEYETDPYLEVTKHSMLVPFLIDSFTGAFYDLPPSELAADEPYEYTKYFVVGDGDIASIRDELYEIRGESYGELYGEILTQRSGEPASDTRVQIFDARQRPYNAVKPDEDGRFRCRLEPGVYYWLVTGEGRMPYSGGEERFSTANLFEIKRGEEGPEDVFLKLYANQPGEIIVNVRDETGRPLPAKVSAVLPYEVSEACKACADESCDIICAPRNYLFDFYLGERRRGTDLNWRNDQPSQRDGEYVERFLIGHDGEVRGTLRPSPCSEDEFGDEVCAPYDLHVSRGPEYEVEVIEGVLVKAGEVRRFDVVLERVLDTEHFISADLHLHAQPSADAYMPLDERMIAGAAEGLEILVASDHNVVTDYQPTITALGLQEWMTSVIGIEMTTMEMGHFNAYPLSYDRTTVNHLPFIRPCEVEDPVYNERLGGKANETSLDWFLCTPTQLFDQMRDLGAYDRETTIVQVNHPRDTILGYFNQFFVHPYTGVAQEPTVADFGEFVATPGLLELRPHPFSREYHQYAVEQFSFDFDALEILNGKRIDLVHHFRTPEDAPQALVNEISDFQCGTGHSRNGRGEILLGNGGLPSYPGALNDWLRMLNLGHTFTGVANSDSHEQEEEIGFPRTYFYLPPDADTGERRDDVPAAIHDLDLVEAILEHRGIGTNGPLLTMQLNTTASASEPGESDTTVVWRVGSFLNAFSRNNVGKTVEVLLSVKSAPWIDVDRVVVYANGEVATTTNNEEAIFYIPDSLKADGRAEDDEWLHTFEIETRVDTVLVAEAFGDQQLFPVVPGKETPPTNINAALSSIMGFFGGGTFGTYDGVHGPSYIQRVYPYAFTNPIWIDVVDQPCMEACVAGGNTWTSCADEECVETNGEFDPPGVGGLPAYGPDEEVPASEMDDCGTDGSCPYNQYCDNSQATPRCRCLELDELRAPGVADTPSPNPSPPMGRAFRRDDIRAVFYSQTPH